MNSRRRGGGERRRQGERAFRFLLAAAAEEHGLADFPAEARTRGVALAVDDYAVVAVNEDVRARRVRLDDVDVMTRHALVRPVDDQRLAARAAHAERRRAFL